MSRSGVGIGLDVGNARVGVARGDFEVRIATPLPMIPNDDETFTNIAKLADDNDAEVIVIGLPRESEGRETAQSQISREFAAQLSEYTGVEIYFQDESLTSVLAEKNLRERKNFNEKMLRDGTVDSEAASIILQDFLDNYSENKED